MNDETRVFYIFRESVIMAFISDICYPLPVKAKQNMRVIVVIFKEKLWY